jgi:RND family efflux transporter MFP subunit
MTSPEENNKIEIERSPKHGGGLIRIIVILVIVAGVWFGYKSYMGKQAAVKQQNEQQQAAANAAPSVMLATVTETDLSTARDYIGRVESIQTVDLKAQVSGQIMNVNFKDGAVVRAGQPLFTIDPSQYQATVDLRKAEIEQANAALDKASKYLKRVKAADPRSISATDIDTAESSFLAAKAALSQAKAALRLAEIDLGHTRVTSPITGKIGVAAFTKGNYVTPSSGSLATIVQLDPIRVVFSLPDRDYLDQLDAFKKNGSVYKTTLVLANGKELPVTGARDYENNEVDAKTGTMQMALRFGNAGGSLIPGSMVRVGTKPVAHNFSIVIPQDTILADSQGDYVFTVDANNIAHQTRVTLGDEIGTMRKVTAGLKVGDKIIEVGLQNVRPEAPVAPQKAEQNKSSSTAAEQAAQSDADVTTASQDKGN